MNNQEQDQEKRLRDRMSRKPQLPKSPSGFFWVYIILVVGLIGFFVPGMMNEVPTITAKDFNALVKHKVVKRMIRVTNENNRMEIVLKNDAASLKDSAMTALVAKFKDKGWRGPVPADVAHLQLESSWTEEFAKDLHQAQLDAGYSQDELIRMKEEKHTSFSDNLSWIIPIVLMVLLRIEKKK